MKRYGISLLVRVVYVAVADSYTPVTAQNLKLRSSPLYGAGKRVDETTTCPNTDGVGWRMFLPSCHHWWFGSLLHPPVLQFFFNEKRYYVNLWLQLYYFFPRTPLLFSLAFVYTNRVIYLGFLINLFFSLCMYVYRTGELSGYGSEHGHRQIKSKQHRLGSVLHVLHRIGEGGHHSIYPLLTAHQLPLPPQYSFVWRPLSHGPAHISSLMAINNVPNKYILNRNLSYGRLWNLLIPPPESDGGEMWV